MSNVSLYQGDCLDILPTLEENSVDTIITDPPYHLQSMVKRFGKEGSAPAQYGKDGAFSRVSRGFMGKCYSHDTEILTEDGWIKISDIYNNKYMGKIYSLNKKTLEIEYSNI